MLSAKIYRREAGVAGLNFVFSSSFQNNILNKCIYLFSCNKNTTNYIVFDKSDCLGVPGEWSAEPIYLEENWKGNHSLNKHKFGSGKVVVNKYLVQDHAGYWWADFNKPILLSETPPHPKIFKILSDIGNQIKLTSSKQKI